MTFVKPESRVVGFDDGPFTFEQEVTPLVGVVTRGGGYVEGVMVDEVAVDGLDATETIRGLLEGESLLETVHAVLVDGGALGGFNVVDLRALHEALDLPVVAVIRDRPDQAAVEAALAEHFEDAEHRLALLTAQPLEEVDLGAGTANIRRVGASLERLEALLRVQTVRGRTPEPLRIAHLIATAVAEGRSRGA